jgi:hypothetical protein
VTLIFFSLFFSFFFLPSDIEFPRIHKICMIWEPGVGYKNRDSAVLGEGQGYRVDAVSCTSPRKCIKIMKNTLKESKPLRLKNASAMESTLGRTAIPEPHVMEKLSRRKVAQDYLQRCPATCCLDLLRRCGRLATPAVTQRVSTLIGD